MLKKLVIVVIVLLVSGSSLVVMVPGVFIWRPNALRHNAIERVMVERPRVEENLIFPKWCFSVGDGRQGGNNKLRSRADHFDMQYFQNMWIAWLGKTM